MSSSQDWLAPFGGVSKIQYTIEKKYRSKNGPHEFVLLPGVMTMLASEWTKTNNSPDLSPAETAWYDHVKKRYPDAQVNTQVPSGMSAMIVVHDDYWILNMNSPVQNLAYQYLFLWMMMRPKRPDCVFKQMISSMYHTSKPQIFGVTKFVDFQAKISHRLQIEIEYAPMDDVSVTSTSLFEGDRSLKLKFIRRCLKYYTEPFPSFSDDILESVALIFRYITKMEPQHLGKKLVNLYCRDIVSYFHRSFLPLYRILTKEEVSKLTNVPQVAKFLKMGNFNWQDIEALTDVIYYEPTHQIQILGNNYHVVDCNSVVVKVLAAHFDCRNTINVTKTMFELEQEQEEQDQAIQSIDATKRVPQSPGKSMIKMNQYQEVQKTPTQDESDDQELEFTDLAEEINVTKALSTEDHKIIQAVIETGLPTIESVLGQKRSADDADEEASSISHIVRQIFEPPTKKAKDDEFDFLFDRTAVLNFLNLERPSLMTVSETAKLMKLDLTSGEHLLEVCTEIYRQFPNRFSSFEISDTTRAIANIYFSDKRVAFQLYRFIGLGLTL